MACDVAAIACTQNAVHGFAVELGEENVRDGPEHGLRRAFEQVRHPHVEFALAQADRVVYRDERVEGNMPGRNGRASAKSAIGFLEDLTQLKAHVQGRVALTRARSVANEMAPVYSRG